MSRKKDNGKAKRHGNRGNRKKRWSGERQGGSEMKRKGSYKAKGKGRGTRMEDYEDKPERNEVKSEIECEQESKRKGESEIKAERKKKGRGNGKRNQKSKKNMKGRAVAVMCHRPTFIPLFGHVFTLGCIVSRCRHYLLCFVIIVFQNSSQSFVILPGFICRLHAIQHSRQLDNYINRSPHGPECVFTAAAVSENV